MNFLFFLSFILNLLLFIIKLINCYIEMQIYFIEYELSFLSNIKDIIEEDYKELIIVYYENKETNTTIQHIEKIF